MLPEELLNCFCLCYVSYFGRCAVCVDVIVAVYVRARLFERHGHRAHGTLACWVRLRYVKCVGRGAVADNLGVNCSTASERVVELLDYQDSRTFTHNKAVPVDIKRPACSCGFIVAGGQSTRRAKRRTPERCDGCFRATGQDGIGHTPLYGLERLAYRVAAGGTCRRRTVVDTPRPEH